jgi:NADH-quinone oxidoreductase subunit M
VSWFPVWASPVVFGLDTVSFSFIVLNNFLFPVALLCSWTSIKYRLKDFILLLLVLQFFLIVLFMSLDLFFFYLFFELVIVPIFIIIGVWGSRLRRMAAAFRFFLYTLAGSLCILMAMLYIYFVVGSFQLYFLYEVEFPIGVQFFLWLAFFLAFAVKVPIFPLHIWLPEAHVEAPTAGSVLLAGILLKLGGYGFLRFLIPLFPEFSCLMGPFVFLLSILGIFYCSFTTIVQVDLKKIIAYSSVIHIAYIVLGLFSDCFDGFIGSIFTMLSHGLISSALFVMIGILYERYGTRLLYYYGGLVMIMPMFSVFLFFFILANLGFPGTSGFIGEFLIILAMFGSNKFVGICAMLGVIFGVIYNIWFFGRVCFGTVSTFIKEYSDLNRREFVLLSFFLFFVCFLGVCPIPFFNFLLFSGFLWSPSF